MHDIRQLPFSDLQVASLLSKRRSKKEQLKNKKQVAEALLGLPKLRLLTFPDDMINYDWFWEAAVESIVELDRAKWQRLHSEGNSVVYKRVLDPTNRG